MPGYEVARSDVKNPDVFDKYQCPHCKLLLKKAVQPECGHWLCESCADELFESLSPKCSRSDCLGDRDMEADYFPDRSVRREIEGLIVSCSNRQKGCQWEDRLVKLDDHRKNCSFATLGCPYCGEVLPLNKLDSHKLICPKALMKCPLADFGCQLAQLMTRDDLDKHVSTHGLEHLNIMADILKLFASSSSSGAIVQDSTVGLNAGEQPRQPDLRKSWEFNSQDSIQVESVNLELDGPPQEEFTNQCSGKFVKSAMVYPSFTKPPADRTFDSRHNASAGYMALLEQDFHEGQAVNSTLESELKQATENHRNGREELATLLQPRSVENGGLILTTEESTSNGTFMWKMDNISQRMAEARKGKYLTEQSKPFYMYDYKMCLEIHLLGDGIGKGTHMSLFFVIMKGEFDNILPWPFTSKVTFKLINQTGGRDIIDTFQPDPTSASLQKPKSDMNIASGCPKFVSHTELMNNGFIVDHMALMIELSVANS